MFLKPRSVFIDTNEYCTGPYSYNTELFSDQKIYIKEKDYEIINYQQQQRWYIVDNLYEYLFKNKRKFLQIIDEEQPLKEIVKPDYKDLKNKIVIAIEKKLLEYKIKGTLIAEQIYKQIQQ